MDRFRAMVAAARRFYQIAESDCYEPASPLGPDAERRVSEAVVELAEAIESAEAIDGSPMLSKRVRELHRAFEAIIARWGWTEILGSDRGSWVEGCLERFDAEAVVPYLRAVRAWCEDRDSEPPPSLTFDYRKAIDRCLPPAELTADAAAAAVPALRERALSGTIFAERWPEAGPKAYQALLEAIRATEQEADAAGPAPASTEGRPITTYDLNAAQETVRALLVAMRTAPGDYARIKEVGWEVVLALRGPNPAYGNIGPGWAYLPAADRRLLRQLHDALCGREGLYYAVSHPEDVEQLAEDALAVSGTRAAPIARPDPVGSRAVESESPPDAAPPAIVEGPEDRLEMILRREGKSTRAALVAFMKGKTSAMPSDVGHAVHGDGEASDKTIRSNCQRVNEDAGANAIGLRYTLTGGRVWKETASDAARVPDASEKSP